MRDVGLDHADQAMAVAEGVVDHGKITRFENIERHLPARQQQGAGQRKYRNDLGQVGRSAIFGIDRHLRSPARIVPLGSAPISARDYQFTPFASSRQSAPEALY